MPGATVADVLTAARDRYGEAFADILERCQVWQCVGEDFVLAAGRGYLRGVLAKSGYLWAKGALDFAGGTVVHINAAIAGLVGAYVIGKRTGFGREAIRPHNLTQTMVGASILWFGWFGFNAGSAL